MRPKIKKMTLDELEDNFQIVDKQEQALYIGGNRIYLNNDGSIANFAGIWGSTTETLILNGHEIEVPQGSWHHRGTANMVDKGTATAMFGFMAQYSGNEWGMAIQNNGTAIIFTDNLDDKVWMLASPNTTKWVHSHPSCCDLSDEDKRMARDYAGKQHFLWYNGQFRQFYEFGFIGNWLPALW